LQLPDGSREPSKTEERWASWGKGGGGPEGENDDGPVDTRASWEGEPVDETKKENITTLNQVHGTKREIGWWETHSNSIATCAKSGGFSSEQKKEKRKT